MKKYLLLTLVALTITISSKAVVQDSIGVIVENGKDFVEYLVSPGETIYRISSNYGVSVGILMEINPELENGLKVGQIIKIPYQKKYVESRKEKEKLEAEAASNNASVHEVLPGETLYSLSKKYGITVGDLLKWNGLELKAGQKIYVSNPIEPVTETEEEKVVPVVERKQQSKQVELVLEEPVVAPPKPQTTSRPVVETKVQEPKRPTAVSSTVSSSEPSVPEIEPLVPKMSVYDFNPNYKQVLVVPFDPHLYFSDADDEIAQASHMPRNGVREVFRRRLNALLDPQGYETIHLMGGRFADTLTDLNKIYSSVTYNYKEILESKYNTAASHHAENEIKPVDESSTKIGSFMSKAKDKVSHQEPTNSHNAAIAKKEERFAGKFFGVQIKDEKFFDYFHQKYSIDYYVFINQFEVVTDYENCLDRAAQNYARHFITHYSIFDKEGNPVSGNKYKTYYNSNSNSVDRIVADNVQKIAQRILNDLPSPGSTKY